jgi:hypothetical protein
MKSSLWALSRPRVRIHDVPRVRSGLRAKFLLRADRIRLKGPQAALALAKRRLPLRAAHGVVTRLYDRGLAVVELPAVENARKVIRDLAGAGVTATLWRAGESRWRSSPPGRRSIASVIPIALAREHRQRCE